MKIKNCLLIILATVLSIPSFAQTEDGTPPEFYSIELSPLTVNNGDSLEVIIKVTDDLSGINYIQVDVENPNGNQRHNAFNHVDRWKALGNDFYSYKIKISEWAVSGEWQVSYIYIDDNGGNTFHKSNDESPIASFNVISSTPDVDPPVFNSISLNPLTVNNGDSIEVTVNVKDAVSGLNYIQVALENPNGQQRHSAFAHVDEWKTLGNDFYSSKVAITEWAAGGEWQVSYIYIDDNAGNTFHKSNYESSIASFVVNASSPDDIAPVFNSVSLSPPKINSGDSLTVFINTLDAVSGINYIQVDVENPNGEQRHNAFANKDRWEDLGNDLYSYKIEISEWAIHGEWQVSYIYIDDIAGNSFHKSNYEGSIATFIVNDEDNNSNENTSSNNTNNSNENTEDKDETPEDLIDAITDINNNNSGIILFPNPFKDQLQIKTNIASNISVIDLYGKTILSSNVNTGVNSINTSSLKSGVYIIKIANADGVFVKRVIKN